MRRLKAKAILFITALFVLTGLATTHTYAAAQDEIVDYEIGATVNEDATVNLVYHIEWKVLDSDSDGPLSWVRVGIPNNHISGVVGLTDNIRSISYDYDSGSYIRIDFDRKYYKDETVTFEFSVVQDYMYQVDKLEEGYTVYSFTPGWFDYIAIDDMTVCWSADKAYSWDPNCLEIDGNLVWNKGAMSPGEKMTVNITYPNDAYGFDLSKKTEEDHGELPDNVYMIIGLIAMAVMTFGPIALIWVIVRVISSAIYRAGAAFGIGTGKKITRTKIVYYENCPGCGAARRDGQTKCDFCGRSMIKSQETIEEKDIRGKEKEAAKFDKEGEFKYTSAPDTFIKVHVVPVSRPLRTYSSGRTSHSHSSCAHSSCACACACACAGGGRAGCSSKDLYKDTRVALFSHDQRLFADESTGT